MAQSRPAPVAVKGLIGTVNKTQMGIQSEMVVMYHC